MWNILFSSYLVEAGFSRVISILAKQRKKLKVEFGGNLRVKLTNFELKRIIKAIRLTLTDCQSENIKMFITKLLRILRNVKLQNKCIKIVKNFICS